MSFRVEGGGDQDSPSTRSFRRQWMRAEEIGGRKVAMPPLTLLTWADAPQLRRPCPTHR